MTTTSIVVSFLKPFSPQLINSFDFYSGQIKETSDGNWRESEIAETDATCNSAMVDDADNPSLSCFEFRDLRVGKYEIQVLGKMCHTVLSEPKTSMYLLTYD